VFTGFLVFTFFKIIQFFASPRGKIRVPKLFSSFGTRIVPKRTTDKGFRKYDNSSSSRMCEMFNLISFEMDALDEQNKVVFMLV
jgi:hypothetical protein